MKTLQTLILGIGLFTGWGLLAQTPQVHYFGANDTGALTLLGTMNLLQVSQAVAPALIGSAAFIPETPHAPYKRPTPPLRAGISSLKIATVPGLTVTPATSFGMNGVTHADQRLSNGGNQWSTEPATPGIAVGNNFIVEGVDDAVQVYNISGTPQLANVVSSNQFFLQMDAIDRSDSPFLTCPGPFLTDMRVFFDPDIQRFIVLQWGQPQGLYSCGNLASSTEWIGVSQTADPTGVWNIYQMDTTDLANGDCPCVPDYPQLGADKYALFISSNEFDAYTETTFAGANILVIAKSDLGSGVATPGMARFVVPYASGFEFAITPATTPPGASYYLASGGLEYFLSSVSGFSSGTSLSLWAMSNTSSIDTLATEGVNLLLTQTFINTQSYTYPNVANQPVGPYPYGQSLFDPESYISGGPDSRILSLTYAGGRLYSTLQSQVLDGLGNSVIGGAYFILSPTFRNNVVSATGQSATNLVLRQGYLAVNSNHLLRPFASVTAQGKGALVFTLVGPSYYPSAAWLPINTTTTGSVIQLAGVGAAPEDGFTGYNGSYSFSAGTARWGDNSAAVVCADGSIWAVTDYISSLPRTTSANWATYIMHINP
jgi:hypothetical protein